MTAARERTLQLAGAAGFPAMQLRHGEIEAGAEAWERWVSGKDLFAVGEALGRLRALGAKVDAGGQRRLVW